MIRLILYVVMVAALAAGAVWFANDPGSVTLIWRGWRLDTSVGILVLILALVAFLLFLVIRTVAAVRGASRAMTAARQARRTEQGLAALGDGFAAVHGGQPSRARKFATDAAALLDDHPATQVLAARAASVAGDNASARTVAEHLLSRAETELSGLRELATRAQDAGDTVAALDHARRALGRKDAPKWALELVLDIEIAKAQWSDALQALDSKIGRQLFDPATLSRVRGYLQTRRAEELLAAGDSSGAADMARKASEAGHRAATVLLVRALAAQDKKRKVTVEVERAWPREASAELLEAYRSAVASEPALEWAKRVERLAATASDHTESRLAVASASLAAGLWGQARNRLMPLLGDDVAAPIRARAALIMAEIEQAERGDAAASIIWLKRASAVGATSGSAAHPTSLAALLAG
ncbi:MAG: hypothetical protein FJX59_13345 [Alphaproteobacteria bacterium]|nr:hypothetical protein [Alphaproteobacteria bacterium]